MSALLSIIANVSPPVVAKTGYVLSIAEVFTLFFVMLGPLKVIGPFFVQTREQAPAAARTLALKICALAAVAVVVGGWAGAALLAKWQISTATLQIAAGLVFLLAALKVVLAQYTPAAPVAAPADPLHLLFPTTVTPYGMAAVILLIASSADGQRTGIIVLLAVLVIALDLVAMLSARALMRAIGPVPLQLLGAVLGVLQVALAVAILLGGLHRAGILGQLPS